MLRTGVTLLVLACLASCASHWPPMSDEQANAVYDRMRFGGGGNQMYRQEPYTMQVPYVPQTCHTVQGIVQCW